LLQKNSGLTLLELLIALSMVAIMGGVSARVLAVAIESWNYSRHQGEAVQNACWALDHIVQRVRSSNRLLLPFRGTAGSTYHELAFSAMVDTDGDGLIDEDPGADMTGDGVSGILGIDDDRNGTVDEGQVNDDDEDGYWSMAWIRVDEDPVDGHGDDGDILIDEDPGGDMNGDGRPGVAGKDDDGDGLIDEGDVNNDDEDDRVDEDPVEYWLYYLDSQGRLLERYYTNAQPEILAEGVTTFQVTRTESSGGRSGISLTLGITKPEGDEIRLKALVYLRDR
jgi:prepilin-type N-terminal cleavage/methylation domain-containing protein